jgi:hypothetical protein
MRLSYAVMALALLAACGEQKKEVKDTVFAPQVPALENARAVEHALQQGAGRQRAAISGPEDAGRGDQQ